LQSHPAPSCPRAHCPVEAPGGCNGLSWDLVFPSTSWCNWRWFGCLNHPVGWGQPPGTTGQGGKPPRRRTGSPLHHLFLVGTSCGSYHRSRVYKQRSVERLVPISPTPHPDPDLGPDPNPDPDHTNKRVEPRLQASYDRARIPSYEPRSRASHYLSIIHTYLYSHAVRSSCRRSVGPVRKA
jgi:hypothetical protein